MKKLLLALSCLALSALASADTTLGNAPVRKFRLPSFNDEGNRVSLLTGDEATLVNPKQIDVKEMHFTLFAGDEKGTVDTTLLAPVATVRIPEPNHTIVEGKGSVRVIRSDLDASGEDWTYWHREKRLVMRNHVHFVLQAELTNILQ